MTFYIGVDHRGVSLKEDINNRLKEAGYETVLSALPNHPEDDYVDFAIEIGALVAKDPNGLGLLICGSGTGMSIAANKVKGIRCARVFSAEDAIKAKEEDGANIIAVPASFRAEEICNMLYAFANAKANTKEKYERRTNKVIAYENGAYNEL